MVTIRFLYTSVHGHKLDFLCSIYKKDLVGSLGQQSHRLSSECFCYFEGRSFIEQRIDDKGQRRTGEGPTIKIQICESEVKSPPMAATSAGPKERRGYRGAGQADSEEVDRVSDSR
jgi:hypothetical protein